MELWDILDENGDKIGRTIERGQLLKDGEYHLVVHVWIRNSKGEYLIQRRSDKVKQWPGIWAVAGGSAVAGESSLDAAMREVREELGINFEPAMLKKLYRVRRKSIFSDLWLVNFDLSLDEITMNKEEVSEVKYAGLEEIQKMINNNEFINFGEDYLSLLNCPAHTSEIRN